MFRHTTSMDISWLLAPLKLGALFYFGSHWACNLLYSFFFNSKLVANVPKLFYSTSFYYFFTISKFFCSLVKPWNCQYNRECTCISPFLTVMYKNGSAFPNSKPICCSIDLAYQAMFWCWFQSMYGFFFSLQTTFSFYGSSKSGN